MPPGFVGLSLAPNYGWALVAVIVAGIGGELLSSGSYGDDRADANKAGRALGFIGMGASVGFSSGRSIRVGGRGTGNCLGARRHGGGPCWNLVCSEFWRRVCLPGWLMRKNLPCKTGRRCTTAKAFSDGSALGLFHRRALSSFASGTLRAQVWGSRFALFAAGPRLRRR